jgi:iron complex outermembrane receptor protein
VTSSHRGRGRGSARRISIATLASTSAVLLGWVPPAQAQQERTLSEVVVTARKQPEAIFDVPLVESVTTRRTLDRRQATDLKDVAALVPGLVLGDSVMANGTQVTIRGVGTSTEDPGNDQSVLLDIDGLQLNEGLAYSSAIFDLGQIEVLKGPQPLFYGKSATAGVISVRSADPTDKAEVIAQTGHEFFADQWRSEFIVSGPVAHTLKLRLAGMYATSLGYFSNAASGLPQFGARDPPTQRLAPSSGYQVRATALWDPTPQLSARLKLNLAHDRTLFAGAQQLVLCPDGVGAPLGIPFLSSAEDCKLDKTYRVVAYDPAAFPGIENGGTPFLATTQTYGTLELTDRPSEHITITSVTAAYHLGADAEANTTNTSAAAPDVAVSADLKFHEVSQELRLNSEFPGPANVTFGVFYSDAMLEFRPRLLGNTTLGLPPLLVAGGHDLPTRTYSAFGQVRWQAAPKVELAVGARWDHERRSDEAFVFDGTEPVPVALAQPSMGSSLLSPEGTLTFRPTDKLMVFATLKRGYKSGSFDVSYPPQPGDDTSFGDERVGGGEVGLKARSSDRRLTLNLTGYDYRYRGLQVLVVSTDNSLQLPVYRTLNAASAQVYGVDLDLDYRPAKVDGLDLHAAVNWNHARFGTFDQVPCYGGQTIAQGCDETYSPAVNRGLGGFTAQDLSGRPLLRAPDWQASFGFDWEKVIGGGLTLVLSSSSQVSSSYLTTLAFPYYQPAFVKTDLSLTLDGRRDRWELALIGKNLGDKLTRGGCANYSAQAPVLFPSQITGSTGRGPAGVDEVSCAIDPGREVWLRLTLRPVN